MNNRPIILKGYGAAKFLAEMAFVDERIDTEYVSPFNRTKIIHGPNGSIRFEPNPNYPYKTREEERIARHKHEQKNREFVHNFLKQKYPETDYAERFLKDNNWGNPLRFHNEETKKCEFLDVDGRHCNKKRDKTTCYTCCFNCSFPEGECDKGQCGFIK